MRGRTVLLIASGLLVLALLIGLKLSLSVDDAGAQNAAPIAVAPPAKASRVADPWQPRDDGAKPAPPAARPAATSLVAAAVAQRIAESTPPAPGEDTSNIPIDEPIPGDKTPIADKPVLREQMEAVEPQVKACLEQFGGTQSGTALLTWIVAGHQGVPTVESPGTDYDNTTITDEKLLDCINQTAMLMKFPPVPHGVTVIGRRKLTIENGHLTGQQFISFSRMY